MIPPFESDGNLPQGIYWSTWEEFVNRFGTTPHRRELLRGLRRAIDSLRVGGCKSVYIGGSLVTSKPAPADFDGCWDIDGVDLSLLDPVLLRFESGRSAQKAKYMGELFPAQFRENGSGETFLDFFAVDKETGDSKGVVALSLLGEWT